MIVFALAGTKCGTCPHFNPEDPGYGLFTQQLAGFY